VKGDRVLRDGSDFNDTLPPHSLEAERAVLGSVLKDAASIGHVAQLASGDFYDRRHRAIWTAMLALHADGQPVDLAMLVVRLQQLGLYEQAGGLDYLVDVDNATATAAFVEHYASIVEHAARSRATISTAQLMAERGFRGDLAGVHMHAMRALELSQSPSVAEGADQDDDDWPAPMHAAAYEGVLGAFVQAVAVQTEADPAAVLAMCLSAISAVFDPHTHMKAGDAYHPVRLNAILVGPTALGRKGTAGKIAEAVALAADEDFSAHIVEGLSSGEGLLWAIRDEITRLDPKTQEEVVIDRGVLDKRLLVMETEFATTLRVLERDGNSLSPIIRRAWDLSPDGVLRSITKNSPARSTGAHIVIAGHITRRELLRYIDSTELVNGFANRFLWFASRRAHTLPFGEETDRELIDNFADYVRSARDWTRDGHRFGWAFPAREAWERAYVGLGSGGDDLFSSVTARGAPQVLRLCGLYAALEGSQLLQERHLAAALAVWGYVERTSRWIFGDATGDPLADAILESLRTSGSMTRTDIVDLFKRHERRARIDQALGHLLTAGLAQCRREPTGGRPAEIWQVAA
jgi:hypothetical protein